MNGPRLMSWYTPSVFRVVAEVVKPTRLGSEMETIVMGPYATKAGARVTKQAQERLLAAKSREAVKYFGGQPWEIEVRVEWTEAEWVRL